MEQPRASRPHMPGYGILGPAEGTGLLPWTWAEERLTKSHDYWLATVRPDGRPHVMPVWGVWDDGAVWFSSSLGSRKAKNLEVNPRAVVTTDDALDPVIVEGDAKLARDEASIARFTECVNGKYGTDYTVDFFGANGLWRLRPEWAFALHEGDFPGSPTRWVFPSQPEE
jgi:PPOX class probable F420-dependent enzyme